MLKRITLALVLAAAGSAWAADTGAIVGGGLGGAAGAAIGQKLDGKNGAIIGAAIGGAAGAAIGSKDSTPRATTTKVVKQREVIYVDTDHDHGKHKGWKKHKGKHGHKHGHDD